MKKLLWICLIVITMMMGPTTGTSDESYRLSMLPRHSPSEILKRITPLACCLTDRTGRTVIPVVERNYTDYEKQVNAGNIQIGYENPVVYVNVSQRHEVLAMAMDEDGNDKFRGLIIVTKTSDIKSVSDLKHRKICVVGMSSAGGYLSPKLRLKNVGLDVEKDCVVIEAVDNKQENVIFSVYTGTVDAGFIKESALHMADAYIPPGQIRVLEEGEWLPNYALSVDRSLPSSIKETIRKTLVGLEKTDPVLSAMHISGFRPSSDNDYDIVRKAMNIDIP